MRRIKTKCATGCLGVALLVLAAACSSASPAQRAGVVRVVAGGNTWGNIASQIGGTHASVTSIVSNPNADPHLFESSVTDARLVAQAAVVIENGAGYDDFLSKLVSATNHKRRIILSAADDLFRAAAFRDGRGRSGLHGGLLLPGAAALQVHESADAAQND